MPVNTETHVNASVVLEKDIYEKLKVVAKREKRSVSKQIAYLVEKMLQDEK
ncbi:hypothetical protein OR1_04146 [Geobacter sp. OR-1]|uniref:ribbon-helix-helix domain-containing protein n=1 Tax=Geobacter sp. OR-1 TaxID=1266765 RepID=UPI0005439B7C|nr:hypothetical protein [Geobacter sp. OR-1]GAM11828.1 hypothetical protein OR1_04146 [Geobacter sp. OR-1]